MTGEIATVQLSTAELAQRLDETFSGELTGMCVQDPDTIVAELPAAKLREVARRLHDLAETPFDCLTLISTVDYKKHLECVYHLYSFAANRYPAACAPRDKAVTDTVCDIGLGGLARARGVGHDGYPLPRAPDRRILLGDDQWAIRCADCID